jgi:hypothetical protein
VPTSGVRYVTDNVIRCHLAGADRDSSDATRSEYIAGVYPLLSDETCWFLAIDFDKQSCEIDARAFVEACRAQQIDAALERSRSGQGAHLWIFFAEPVPAVDARKLGALLITSAMERRPDIGFESYDRFFPSQDTRPTGGFGNLIALPFQDGPRRLGNSVFVDDEWVPYEDQWAYLSGVSRLRRLCRWSVLHRPPDESSACVSVDGDNDERLPPSRRTADPPVRDKTLPERVSGSRESSHVDQALRRRSWRDASAWPPSRTRNSTPRDRLPGSWRAWSRAFRPRLPRVASTACGLPGGIIRTFKTNGNPGTCSTQVLRP